MHHLCSEKQINGFCRYVYTKLLAVLGKARRPDDALQIFSLMCVSNIIDNLRKSDAYKVVLEFFDSMLYRGTTTYILTWPHITV